MEEHTESMWWSQDLNPSVLVSSLSLITTLNWFPKHGIRRWPSVQVLPSHTCNGILAPTDLSVQLQRQAMLCLAPSISSGAELCATLFLLEKEQSLRYECGSYQQRDDIGNQMNRCGCPNAEAGRGKPGKDNLKKRSKIGTMQRRLGISSREGRNENPL